MADHQEYRTLTRAELEQLAGQALPERAAVSLINAGVAVPVAAKTVVTGREGRKPGRRTAKPG